MAKMIKTYMPNALMRAVSDVVKAHPIEKKVEDLSDNDLMSLLNRIEKCTTDHIRILALSLLPREIMALCRYFPHNKFRKPVENIEAVISLNMKPQYYDELVMQWQKYPHSRGVLKLLAQYDKPEIRGNKPKIPVGRFAAWFRSGRCFADVNAYVKSVANSYASYETRFEDAGFLPRSPLQTVCFTEYLVSCKLHELVQAGDSTIARCVQQADTETAEMILLNLLICGDSDRGTLKTFKHCYDVMLGMWKAPSSNRFPANQTKARNVYIWLYNYIEMVNGFSSDADHRRRNFWEKYLDRCEVTRIKNHRMVVFYFQNYCAVEFEVVGRIFIYKREYFKTTVLPHAVNTRNTQDTKSWMLNLSDYEFSKTHQGRWENDAALALRMIL